MSEFKLQKLKMLKKQGKLGCIKISVSRDAIRKDYSAIYSYGELWSYISEFRG